MRYLRMSKAHYGVQPSASAASYMSRTDIRCDGRMICDITKRRCDGTCGVT
jgi:hypothetical protein